jgi:hypothetical protein
LKRIPVRLGVNKTDPPWVLRGSAARGLCSGLKFLQFRSWRISDLIGRFSKMSGLPTGGSNPDCMFERLEHWRKIFPTWTVLGYDDRHVFARFQPCTCERLDRNVKRESVTYGGVRSVEKAFEELLMKVVFNISLILFQYCSFWKVLQHEKGKDCNKASAHALPSPIEELSTATTSLLDRIKSPSEHQQMQDWKSTRLVTRSMRPQKPSRPAPSSPPDSKRQRKEGLRQQTVHVEMALENVLKRNKELESKLTESLIKLRSSEETICQQSSRLASARSAQGAKTFDERRSNARLDPND